jgi:DNA topoisomerase I
MPDKPETDPRPAKRRTSGPTKRAAAASAKSGPAKAAGAARRPARPAATRARTAKAAARPAAIPDAAAPLKAASPAASSAGATTRLIVVESPAKARTIQRFAGKGFRVKASFGHVRDLPKNPKRKGDPDWIGVDEENDFQPHYEVLADKKKHIEEIVKNARLVDEVLLAGDPDREGEAICWHLDEVLKARKVTTPVRRILFHEITRQAVRAAIDSPQTIALAKVDAQQARRILDRIVGYRVSPLLWKKVRRGLSAGRVQTVALRMIVEREREIRDFRAVEYWTIAADLLPQGPGAAPFEAKLVGWRGEPAPWKKEGDEGRLPTLPDEAAAREAEAHIRAAELRVVEVEAKRARRSPPPPFTTSKLQQEAARRFHFPVRSTMRVAQGLYEGKDVGDRGTVGLITYMRTDSIRVAAEAIDAVRAHIGTNYGDAYLPAEARVFKQKGRSQDAHEAIRPTSLDLPPERVAPFLASDELKLYTLIWNRFVASQMALAEFDATRIDIAAGEALLRATGQVQRFAGWLQVYQELRDEEDGGGNANGADAQLPQLAAGDPLTATQVRTQANTTQPPSRYSEAMLVRALEENGIGRPSTYAAILSVIADKDYVEKEEGRFRPTRLGEIVLDLLLKHFSDIFDIQYTARLEEELDKIEEGEQRGVDTLRTFAAKFNRDLALAREEMKDVKTHQEPTDFVCDICGAPMVKRWGRFGEFLACERYPECRGTRDLGESEQPLPSISEVCPQCGKPMSLRRGRWGVFLACTGYPECRTTRRVNVTNGTVEVKHEELLAETCPQCGKPLARKHGRHGEYVGCSGHPACRYVRHEETGVACPLEGCTGTLVVKRTQRGKRFYGCSRYPDCTYAVWAAPVNRPCPQCGHPFMLERETKRDGAHYACPKCKAKIAPDAPAQPDGAPDSVAATDGAGSPQ